MPGTQLRRGLRPKPMDGWPLDDVLVGVGTLRTMRELFRQNDEAPREGPRAWDLALRCGVSAQGAADSLERLERAGLVRALTRERPWRARGYRLKRHHPLVVPMRQLFEAERSVARREDRRYGWRRRDRRYRRPRGPRSTHPGSDDSSLEDRRGTP